MPNPARPDAAPLIAVTTPTGQVGSALVRHLVRAGVRPRVLVRDPARLADDIADHLDVVTVDLTDREKLRDALAGVDALYWVSPTIGGDDPVADHVRLGRELVDAIGPAGVSRVVFQSSIGAEARHGFGEIDGLGAVEQLLDDTGIDVCHLRCAYFFTNLLLDPTALERGELAVTLPTDTPFAWVAPDDIAAVAAGRLLAPWRGRVVQAVHGPTDLSFADAAGVVADVTGRPLRAVRISDDEQTAALRSAGMSERQAAAIVGMTAGMRDGFVPEQPRDVITTTPTTLGAWAWQHLRNPGAHA